MLCCWRRVSKCHTASEGVKSVYGSEFIPEPRLTTYSGCPVDHFSIARIYPSLCSDSWVSVSCTVPFNCSAVVQSRGNLRCSSDHNLPLTSVYHLPPLVNYLRASLFSVFLLELMPCSESSTSQQFAKTAWVLSCSVFSVSQAEKHPGLDHNCFCCCCFLLQPVGSERTEMRMQQMCSGSETQGSIQSQQGTGSHGSNACCFCWCCCCSCSW